jgi:hypothetical protein
MLRRHLSPELIKALNDSPFWNNICADHELQPEIRDGHVTVYYRGRGLIRQLQLEDGRLTAKTNQKYIPISFTGKSADVGFVADMASGLQFTQEGQPEPLRLCDIETLGRYKTCAVAGSEFPEGDLVQKIVCHNSKNQIVDQEIAFQRPGESRDKVDICYFDTKMNRLVFVEVKRREDGRLVGSGRSPKVLQQLSAYGQRLKDHRDEILDAYRHVVSWKRRLGLGDRLNQVPDNGPSDLLEKPLLVIGDCNKDDVHRIMGGEDGWAPLLDGLKDVAAGLILCGTTGCRLSLNSRQGITFPA